MVRSDDLFIAVPSYFRCPISLDVMKSPVSLCTGVTYDRSSIQAWLDTGHNTCPATMQVLPSTDFVPNLTLHSLIQHWSSTTSSDHHSVHQLIPAVLPSSNIVLPDPSLTPDAALLLLRHLGSHHHPTSSLRQLRRFADESYRNRRLLVDNGCVGLVAGFLASSDADCSKEGMDAVEAGVRLLGSVMFKEKLRMSEEDEKAVLGNGFWSVLLLALRKGSFDCRVDAAVVIESIFTAGNDGVGNGLEKKATRAVSIDTLEILLELIKLSGWEADAKGVDAGLAALLAVAGSSKSISSQIAGHGGVSLLARLLERPETSVVEGAIALIEALSSCPDGRAAISAHPACVPVMVDRIFKVSVAATERAVGVLWSLCCVFQKEAAREKMMKSNTAAKMLLLLQCNCSSAVRRMAVDLFKLVKLALVLVIKAYVCGAVRY